MVRMRMEAVVPTFEAVFRHLLAKMRDYEKPQPANTPYLAGRWDWVEGGMRGGE